MMMPKTLDEVLRDAAEEIAVPPLDLQRVQKVGNRRKVLTTVLVAAALTAAAGGPTAYWLFSKQATHHQPVSENEIRFVCEHSTYSMVTPDGTEPVHAQTATEAVRQTWVPRGRLAAVQSSSGETRVWVLRKGSDTEAVAYYILTPTGGQTWETAYYAACPGHEPVP